MCLRKILMIILFTLIIMPETFAEGLFCKKVTNLSSKAPKGLFFSYRDKIQEMDKRGYPLIGNYWAYKIDRYGNRTSYKNENCLIFEKLEETPNSFYINAFIKNSCNETTKQSIKYECTKEDVFWPIFRNNTSDYFYSFGDKIKYRSFKWIKSKLNLDKSESFLNDEELKLGHYNDLLVCIGATDILSKANYSVDFELQIKKFKNDKDSMFFAEAIKRNLNCIDILKSPIEPNLLILNTNNMQLEKIASNQNKDPSKRPLAKYPDKDVCDKATIGLLSHRSWNDRNDNFVGEAKYRGLDCGVKSKNVEFEFRKTPYQEDKNNDKAFFSNNLDSYT